MAVSCADWGMAEVERKDGKVKESDEEGTRG